jgi:iron complex transport system ATP-binding protein
MKEELTYIRLQAENLSVGYTKSGKKIPIVENIYIDIQKPTFVAILGKNGAGKSTLLRTLAQLQPALSGSIHLNQKIVKNSSVHDEAKLISVVLTEVEKGHQFNVYEMVAFGRSVYTNWIDQLTAHDKMMIENAMKWTGIQHLRHQKVAELSDGQRQKVLVARALAQDTPIILLDEPTVHLDVHHAMEMFHLFRKWVDEHQKTLILTTHEIGLATQLSDEIWIIDQGKILQEPTEKILENNRIDQFFNTELIHFNKLNHTFEYIKTK